MLFAVTDRKWKPRKHLMLGLAMNKLTSCRRVIKILNRVGYSVSYSTVEKLETELPSQFNSESQATPSVMEHKSQSQHQDRLDTVGIVYPDLIEPDAENGASCSNIE